MEQNRQELNRNLAQMLKGGVIMDVTTPEQARIAEEAGACAVMALERIPADIRAAGGVSRMSDPKMIKGIQAAVSIPVMAKCRIGHFVEAQILQAIEIDYIDESEVLSPADNIYHIDKTQFEVPFVCGARNLSEALRRIAEGATMIRTKGEPGTGDVVQAVSHMRLMQAEIRRLVGMSEDELFEAAKQLQAPYDLVKYVHDHGKLPVVNFAAGGACRRCADDAAGRRGCLRRIGYLQERRPREACRCHCPGRDQLQGCQEDCRAERGPGRGDGWHQRAGDQDPHGRARTIMRIAVLALQGAFIEHERMLQQLGAECFEVRQLSDWNQPKDGLVIPGGESTTMLKLLHDLELLQPIREAIAGGLPVFGTCAGLILLAKEVEGEEFPRLSTMDIRARRNAYGRQLGSFHTSLDMAEVGTGLPATFIRAPYIESVEDDVRVLASVDGHIVAARQGNQLVTAFHPELDSDLHIHKYFLSMIAA